MSGLSRPTAILLDWDGTVVNTLPLINKAHNVVLNHFGKPAASIEETQRLTAFEAHQIMAMLVDDPAGIDEAFRIFYRTIEAEHLNQLTLLPDVSTFVDKAAALRIPLGIVSNKQGKTMRMEIAQLGWTDRFAAVFGANEAPENKPSGAPALAALAQLGVPPSKAVWFIGDTGGDMACAAAAGLTGIYVAHQPPQPGWDCDAVTDFGSLLNQL